MFTNKSWIFIKGAVFGVVATLILEYIALWLFGFVLSGGQV